MTAGPEVRIYRRSHLLRWNLAARRRLQRARGGRTRGRGGSLPPKEKGYAARSQPPGSSSSDASDLMISVATAATVAVDRSPPSKRMRAPEAESFVLSPSSSNCKYPSVVDPYLPIGHLSHDIPPPDPGGSLVVVTRTFRAAGGIRG